MGRTSISYSYDNNGNLTSSTENGETTSYTWNDENHLISVTHPDSSTETYLYCGEGIRRRKTTSTENLLFIRDGQNILQERDGSSGTTIRHYTHQSDGWGELVGLKQSGDSHFYGFDLNGNTRILSDEAGAVSDSYVYTAFGKEQASSGATVNPLGYGGNWGYYRESAERVYIRARHLSVSAGRWYSNDPLGFNAMDWNLYRAMGNNLITNSDPTGTIVKPPIVGPGQLAPGNSIYTCGCGWIDGNHYEGGKDGVKKAYETLMSIQGDGMRGRVNNGTKMFPGYPVSLYKGAGFNNVLTNVKVAAYTGTDFPPKHSKPAKLIGNKTTKILGKATFQINASDQPLASSALWKRMAEYMTYGALWEVEATQNNGQIAHNVVREVVRIKSHNLVRMGELEGKSGFSYEDLVSNWVGGMSQFYYPDGALKACGKILDANQALNIYKLMESASVHSSNSKQRQSIVDFPHNPTPSAIKLFHTAYGSTKKYCPAKRPRRSTIGPADLYGSVGLNGRNINARYPYISEKYTWSSMTDYYIGNYH